jgi:hypothetical protein
MSDQKTHWKKLTNPDYIGAYALNPGQDMILTIKSVSREMVSGADGKKEECTIIRFAEAVKPMIANTTNQKMIQKIYRTPYIEDWAGRKIQIYSESVKAFGDTVDALRIRPFIPKAAGKVDTVCADCNKPIADYQGVSAEQLAAATYKKYGKALCYDCSTVEKGKTAAIDPLGGE